jgi:hypothetical protein
MLLAFSRALRLFLRISLSALPWVIHMLVNVVKAMGHMMTIRKMSTNLDAMERRRKIRLEK